MAVARKVAAGAAEFVPVAAVTNLARALEHAQGARRLGGRDGRGGRADACMRADLDRPLALVLGAEGDGMRRLTRERCDFLVRIPMAGQIESLERVGGGGRRSVRGGPAAAAGRQRAPGLTETRPERVILRALFRRPPGFTPCLTARNGRLQP